MWSSHSRWCKVLPTASKVLSCTSHEVLRKEKRTSQRSKNRRCPPPVSWVLHKWKRKTTLLQADISTYVRTVLKRQLGLEDWGEEAELWQPLHQQNLQSRHNEVRQSSVCKSSTIHIRRLDKWYGCRYCLVFVIWACKQGKKRCGLNQRKREACLHTLHHKKCLRAILLYIRNKQKYCRSDTTT